MDPLNSDWHNQNRTTLHYEAQYGKLVLLNLMGFFLRVYQKVKNHSQNWKKCLKKWFYCKRYFRVNASNIIEAREEFNNKQKFFIW